MTKSTCKEVNGFFGFLKIHKLLIMLIKAILYCYYSYAEYWKMMFKNIRFLFSVNIFIYNLTANLLFKNSRTWQLCSLNLMVPKEWFFLVQVPFMVSLTPHFCSFKKTYFAVYIDGTELEIHICSHISCAKK